MFKDIIPVLFDQQLCEQIVAKMISDLNGIVPDKIAAIESRGFLFGMMLANKLQIPFVPIRKAGKLPYKTYKHSYQLEYGSAEIEMHVDAIKEGDKVLIHDDLLATGGTAAAAAHLINLAGGVTSSFSFIINLGFLNGSKPLLGYSPNINCLATY
ncbi:UNVERIFIED_CONTAM: hypothetical protein GTU68_019937 [Idotea baltica]|nr:hypothetical protein [Idotea baltica]